MKFRQLLEKYVWTIIIFFIVIAIVITILALHTDASRSIEDQITDLYEKERIVSEDFSKAYELSNVTCYINEDNNTFIFTSEDCELTVKYSKDGEVLTKEFKDTRLGIDFFLCVLIVIFISICTFMASGALLVLLHLVLTMVEEKVIKQKRKKSDEADRKRGDTCV